MAADQNQLETLYINHTEPTRTGENVEVSNMITMMIGKRTIKKNAHELDINIFRSPPK